MEEKGMGNGKWGRDQGEEGGRRGIEGEEIREEEATFSPPFKCPFLDAYKLRNKF